MPRFLLIGDSVIDNAAYVRPGEPDVAVQVQGELPDWIVGCGRLMAPSPRKFFSIKRRG